MMEQKTLLDRNLVSFMRDFQEHVQLGWEIDDNSPPQMWGICYEACLLRTDKTIAALVTRADATEDGKPKLTQAENLQKAREVLAAKRQAQKVLNATA